MLEVSFGKATWQGLVGHGRRAFPTAVGRPFGQVKIGVGPFGPSRSSRYVQRPARSGKVLCRTRPRACDGAP